MSSSGRLVKSPDADGYEVIDVGLESVSQTAPTLIGQTYHLLGRGRSATIRDFDFILTIEVKRSVRSKISPHGHAAEK